MKNDPTVKRRVVRGHVIWEIVEEEQPKVPSISLEIPTVGPKGEKDKGKDKEEMKPGPWPGRGKRRSRKGSTFSAPRGGDGGQRPTLRRFPPRFPAQDPQADCQEGHTGREPRVSQGGGHSGQARISKRCVGGFSRTDEQFRPTYELIRQGKMPESESLLGRTLNTFSAQARRAWCGRSGSTARKSPTSRWSGPPGPGRHGGHQRGRRLVRQGLHVAEVGRTRGTSAAATRSWWSYSGATRPVGQSNLAQNGCWRSPRVRTSSKSVSRFGPRFDVRLFTCGR